MDGLTTIRRNPALRRRMPDPPRPRNGERRVHWQLRSLVAGMVRDYHGRLRTDVSGIPAVDPGDPVRLPKAGHRCRARRWGRICGSGHYQRTKDGAYFCGRCGRAWPTTLSVEPRVRSGRRAQVPREGLVNRYVDLGLALAMLEPWERLVFETWARWASGGRRNRSVAAYLRTLPESSGYRISEDYIEETVDRAAWKLARRFELL